MKIAILTSRFPPEGIGGTEFLSYNTAKYLAKSGNEVYVITSGGKEAPAQEIKEGFNICRISYPKLSSFGVLIFWVRIYFYIKKINPDIVHCQTAQMGPPCLLAKKMLGIPYIVFGHGSDIYLSWKFKKTISKTIFSSAGAVVALTNHMKNAMAKYCKKEIIIIPNGASMEDFGGLSKETARTKLKISPQEKVILFVGRIITLKGVEYLVEAFLTVKKKIQNVKLFLLGEGEQFQEVQSIVKKSKLVNEVIFTGNVPVEDIPCYMAASDIFVLPSLSEGFPLVIIEAMASGLPIVATKVTGLPEIVKDGENGFLVEAKNPDQIAEKVLLLLKDDNLRERISKINKERSKEYSLENVVDKLEKIYLEIINKNKKIKT